MARSRYTLVDSDGFIAWRWADNKLSRYELRCTQDGKQGDKAQQALKDTKHGERITALNTWAETFLSSAEWTQLKNVIRAHRKRQEDRLNLGRGKIHIALTEPAHTILRAIAKHDDITYSEAIIKYMGKRFDTVMKSRK